MTRVSSSAVHIVDRIVRNVRDAIEDGAKRYAKERGEDEATPDDVITAATVMFESDHKELLR